MLLNIYFADESRREAFTNAALDLLRHHGRVMDPVAVLQTLPKELPVKLLQPYLAQIIPSTAHKARHGQVVKSLYRYEHVRINCELVRPSVGHFIVIARLTTPVAGGVVSHRSRSISARWSSRRIPSVECAAAALASICLQCACCALFRWPLLCPAYSLLVTGTPTTLSCTCTVRRSRSHAIPSQAPSSPSKNRSCRVPVLVLNATCQASRQPKNCNRRIRYFIRGEVI